MTTMKSINPATGEILAEYPMLSAEALEGRLALAMAAAVRWRATPVAERAAVVARLGALLDAEKKRLGRLMTLEMGKPIQAAIDEAASARPAAATTPNAVRRTWPMRASTTTGIALSCRISRWAWCWRSCRGTFRSGR